MLLVGGGEGVGSLGENARALAMSDLPLQLIVVTGRNKALYEELHAESASWAQPAAIMGFVQNMPDMMRASDVIVTKAGPGTIAESLACGLPIILTGAIPGQEVGNIDYVIDQHVGVLARSPELIVAAVRQLLDALPPERAAIRDHARSLSNPRAAFDIAQLILSYVPPARSIPVWTQAPRYTTRRRVLAARNYRRAQGRNFPLRQLLPGFAPLRQLPDVPPLRRLPRLMGRRTQRLRTP